MSSSTETVSNETVPSNIAEFQPLEILFVKATFSLVALTEGHPLILYLPLFELCFAGNITHS